VNTEEDSLPLVNSRPFQMRRLNKEQQTAAAEAQRI